MPCTEDSLLSPHMKLCNLDKHGRLMPTTESIQLVLEALILLLLLYMAFLKSYFQEKGKNVATKEDVEEITSLVEAVKSQLQFSLQAKLSLRTEEHQTLVDYFSKYWAWLSAITNCSTLGITKNNMSGLAEIRSQLDMLHRDFELATGKMELFVENEDIQSQHGPLVIETLKFQAHAQQVTYEIEALHLETKQMQLQTPLDQQLERYRELLGKEKELYKKFKEEQLQTYKALLPVVQKQRRAISTHIRALANGSNDHSHSKPLQPTGGSGASRLPAGG